MRTQKDASTSDFFYYLPFFGAALFLAPLPFVFLFFIWCGLFLAPIAFFYFLLFFKSKECGTKLSHSTSAPRHKSSNASELNYQNF
jgi:hypothetical protein